MKSANFFVLFYNVHKENMFTIDLEDGYEAPLKPSTYKITFPMECQKSQYFYNV